MSLGLGVALPLSGGGSAGAGQPSGAHLVVAARPFSPWRMPAGPATRSSPITPLRSRRVAVRPLRPLRHRSTCCFAPS
eukprot:3996498-Alexandrium_andersonii.AAC.1